MTDKLLIDRATVEKAISTIESTHSTIQDRLSAADALRAALANAELAELAATEPSMIYHGRCVIDCGDSGHHNVTMLKMIARETKLFTRPMPAQDVEDAARYRWIRLHCYVDTFRSHPRSDLSMFDAAIDAAIAKGAKQ